MAKRKIQTFEYKSKRITFDFGDGIKMVNATQMAKAFGKKIDAFFRLKQTAEYVNVLYKSLKYSRDDNSSLGKIRSYNAENLAKYYPELIKVVRGGIPELQGTWLHEKLALKFAAWLSPEFELWVYDRIHELLTTGRTEIPTGPSTGLIARTLRLIAEQLEEQDRTNEEVRIQLLDASDRIDEIQAKLAVKDESYYTIKGYCKLNAFECPRSQSQKWGYAATKLSNQKGVLIGREYDAQFGEINSYHIDILKLIIK